MSEAKDMTIEEEDEFLAKARKKEIHESGFKTEEEYQWLNIMRRQPQNMLV